MSYPPFSKNTPVFIGVFFCTLILSCKEERTTPTWQQEHIEELVTATTRSNQKAPRQDYQVIRFLSYNLKNYLTMNRGSHDEALPKPEKETKALIEIITDSRPDILGVCEIGTQKDLEDLQRRLKERGLHLSHTYITRGADPVRSLAILSRFPISETTTAKKLYYQAEGLRLQMSRGILDATISLPDRDLRFLGAHLKSKRPSKTADQAFMRRQESMLLRQHADHILNEAPHTQLIVYGDFNDTKRSIALNTLRGRSSNPRSLSTIELKDPRGETWTHYWNYEDIYSRFDYVMTSPTLRRHIDRSNSAVLAPEHWNTASDHRPLLVIIK